MAIRKKKIDYTPYLIGLGAAGVIGYLFRKEIKNLITGGPNQDFIPDENIVNPPVVIENIVTPGGNVAVKSQITKGLSPLGTPKDRLNFDQKLKKGDRGQEVAKLQQILNRIAKITGSIQIKEDGIFGTGTESRLNKVTGNNSINLYKAYLILFAIWNAKNQKDVKNWYKNYYQYYLTQPDRLKNARTYYFAKNQPI